MLENLVLNWKDQYSEAFQTIYQKYIKRENYKKKIKKEVKQKRRKYALSENKTEVAISRRAAVISPTSN